MFGLAKTGLLSDKVRLTRVFVVVFWVLFWFLNTLDKFIPGQIFLWVGIDRLSEFVAYFSLIGINARLVPLVFYFIVTIAEGAAFVLMAMALWFLVRSNKKKAGQLFFCGTLVGLAIFTFFGVGDQMFGDRKELLEHSTYWVIVLASYAVYRLAPKF